MNLHYEFWVYYYDELLKKMFAKPLQKEEDKVSAEKLSKQLVNHTWTCEGGALIPQQECSSCFRVNYPGLLIGLGYTHEAKEVNNANLKGQISNGFSLDYVTGLPYIPGSEVKGILRSAFMQNRDYALEVFNEVNAENTLNKRQLVKLERECFGTRHPYEEDNERDTEGCGTDVFLDAWPVKADSKGRLLGLENITPHRAENSEDDGLTEPNPVTILKIMPGVEFQFRFILEDTVLSDEKDGTNVTVTADQKKKFYERLLTDLGAGAKTNVGFGVLTKLGDTQGKRYLVKSVQQPAQKTKTDGQKQQEGGGQQLQQPKQGTQTKQNGKSQNTSQKGGHNNEKAKTPQDDAKGSQSIEDERVGIVYKGRVTKIQQNGVLVWAKKYGVGLARKSDHKDKSDSLDFLRVDDQVNVKIISVNEKGQLSLRVEQKL